MYVLDDHDEKRELDSKCLAGVDWTSDESCSDIGAHDLQNRRLDILIRQSLDMSILN